MLLTLGVVKAWDGPRYSCNNVTATQEYPGGVAVTLHTHSFESSLEEDFLKNWCFNLHTGIRYLSFINDIAILVLLKCCDVMRCVMVINIILIAFISLFN